MDINQKRLLAKRKLAKQKLQSVPTQPVQADIPVEPGATIAPPLHIENGGQDTTPWQQQGDEMFQPQEPSAPSNLEVAGQTLLNDVPANILGAPMDLLNFGANTVKTGAQLITDGPNSPYDPLPAPPGGSEWIKDNLFRDIADPDTYTKGQKRASTIGGIAAETMLGGVGLASRAGRVDDASDIMKTLVEPYVDNAKTQIAKDAVSGAGAGAGLQVAEENEMGPIATLMSMLVGGAGAAKSADTFGSIATAGPKAIDNRSKVDLGDGGEVINKGLQKDAARTVQGMVNDPIARVTGVNETPALLSKKIGDNIAQNEADGIRGQTAGPMSESYALSGLERSARIENPTPFKQTDEVFKGDVTQKIQSLGPENADIEAPQKLARQKGTQMVREAQEGVDTARNNQYDLDRQTQDTQLEGEELIAPVQAQRGQKGAASSQLNEQIGPDGALGERTKTKNDAFDKSAEGAFVDAKTLLKTVEDINNSKSSLTLGDNKISSKLTDSIRRFIPEKGTLEGPGSKAGLIPADEVLKLRRDLNSEISSAQAKGDYAKADTYKELKKAINDTIDVDPQFKEANTNYKENYAPFFAQGYGKKYRDTVQKGDGTGQSDPEKIADIFLAKGRNAAQDLARIVEIAPDSDSASKAVERYLTSDLASKLGDKLNPRLVRSWLDDNSDKLTEFPEVRAKFEKLQSDLGTNVGKTNELKIQIKQASDVLKDAEKNLDVTQKRINKGVLGSLINDDPDKYVKTIMGGNDRLKRIRDTKKLIGTNKDAMDGLKKAIVDDLVDRSSDVDGNLTLAKMKKADVDALAEIYTPEEMNTVRRMSKALERQRKLDTKTTPGSDTEQNRRNQTMKTALEAYLKLKYGVLKGGGIMRSVAVAGKLIPDRKDQIEKVIQRAMLDPKVAKMLLDTDVSKIDTKFNKQLNAIIASHHSVKAVQAEEDDQE